MARYFLGIDGGGSKTQAVCADAQGTVVGRGLAGPTSLTTTSVGAASFNLIEAIRQAIETLPKDEEHEFAKVVMGLAGMDSEAEKEKAFGVFSKAIDHYPITEFILVNDSIIALENGSSSQNSLIVISGTGSVCFGRNSQGKTARNSGMDFLLTDQGSGYAIGRRVLREAVKSYDGRAAKSILEKLVCEEFRINSIAELKTQVYNPTLNKIEVAALAPLCTKAYEQGDPVAEHIFKKVSNEIIVMATTVIEKLSLKSASFDCVFSGAVMKLPLMKEKVSADLQQRYNNISIIFPDTEPVFGAVKLALK